MATVKNVLIVGGGIGGLSAGIALRRAGAHVDLAELNPAYNVYGVGIIQTSNALRALDSLGLADACMERGSPYGKVKMCSASGHMFTEIGTPPMGRLPVHNGISRRILHDVLHECAQAHGVAFRMGLTVSAIENTDEDVSVTFSDGSTGRYDLLVGADGAKSLPREGGGRGPRGRRSSKARPGHSAGPMCHLRWSAYGKRQKRGRRRSSPRSSTISAWICSRRRSAS